MAILIKLMNGATKMRAGVICFLVVILFDVVGDGGYVFSAVACPIWLAAASVKAAISRPNSRLAAASILMPIVTALAVYVNYSLQCNLAMGNAAKLINACEKYDEVSGTFPKRLDDLVPKYLDSIPRAKYCLGFGDFFYVGTPRPSLMWWQCPPFGRRVYSFQTGTWHYLD